MQNDRKRIVHIGAGGFALAVLKGLLSTEHEVVGVLPWNKSEFQGLKSVIKRYFIKDLYSLITQNNLHILNSQKTRDKSFVRELAELKPDILIVSGWGEILREDVITIAKIATVNVHPSYLPAHRGVNPIETVLYESESSTGVTFHYLTPDIDSGNIILQNRIDIAEAEIQKTLELKIHALLPQMVLPAIQKIISGDKGDTQDNTKASYFRKISHNKKEIDWSASAEVIERKIRTFHGKPGAFTFHKGKQIQIQSAIILKSETRYQRPGEIIDKIGTNLVVTTGEPQEVLILDNLAFFGSLGGLKAKLYSAQKISIGDSFE